MCVSMHTFVNAFMLRENTFLVCLFVCLLDCCCYAFTILLCALLFLCCRTKFVTGLAALVILTSVSLAGGPIFAKAQIFIFGVVMSAVVLSFVSVMGQHSGVTTGYTGLNSTTLKHNLKDEYQGESFHSVFGMFVCPMCLFVCVLVYS